MNHIFKDVEGEHHCWVHRFVESGSELDCANFGREREEAMVKDLIAGGLNASLHSEAKLGADNRIKYGGYDIEIRYRGLKVAIELKYWGKCSYLSPASLDDKVINRFESADDCDMKILLMIGGTLRDSPKLRQELARNGIEMLHYKDVEATFQLVDDIKAILECLISETVGCMISLRCGALAAPAGSGLQFIFARVGAGGGCGGRFLPELLIWQMAPWVFPGVIVVERDLGVIRVIEKPVALRRDDTLERSWRGGYLDIGSWMVRVAVSSNDLQGV